MQPIAHNFPKKCEICPQFALIERKVHQIRLRHIAKFLTQEVRPTYNAAQSAIIKPDSNINGTKVNRCTSINIC